MGTIKSMIPTSKVVEEMCLPNTPALRMALVALEEYGRGAQMREYAELLIGAIELIASEWESGNLAEAVGVAREMAEGIKDSLKE
jgi:hypothetical protein